MMKYRNSITTLTEIHTGEAVHAILTVIAVTLCVKHKVGVINSLVAEGTEVNDLFVYQQFKRKTTILLITCWK